MEKFSLIQGVVADLDLVNIDTDMIIPKQFLKTIKRSGLGKALFYEMRYDLDGKLIEDFILNKEPFTETKVLLAGQNFGCGSSREHAPWAITDFGIKVVIAPSFADIFYNNSFNNSLLPIVLPQEKINEIRELIATSDYRITVDLTSQTISCGNKSFKFDISPEKKKKLLLGLDDIGETLQHIEEIESFESVQKKKLTWLYDGE